MAELVGRKPTPHAGGERSVAQLNPDSGRRTRPAACWPAQHAEERTDRKCSSDREPRHELLPGPAIHSHLTALAALTPPDKNRAAGGIEIALGESECFADPQPSSPEHDDQAPQPETIRIIAGNPALPR